MKSNTAENYSAIASKTINLRSVTPITIHGGANEGKTPELRLSTVNGMMRYWYGALDNRRDKEKDIDLIFGYAESKDSHKSIIWLTDDMYRKDIKEERFRPSHSDTRKVTISALPVDMNWPITVSTKKTKETYLQEGVNALETAVLFGGFGQRGRHGGSSFILPELEIDNANDLLLYLKSLTDFYQVNTTEISPDALVLTNTEKQHTKVTWLATKVIETSLTNVNTILSNIRKATHDADNKEIGLKGVLGSPDQNKYASPLHTSIYRYKNGKYAVMVTETFHETKKTSKYTQAKNLYISNLQRYLKGE